MGNSNSKADQGFLGGILMVGGIVATIATGGAAVVITGPLIVTGSSMLEDALNHPDEPPNYTIGAGVSYSNDGHGTIPYVGDHVSAQTIRENIANDDANKRSQEQMKKDIEKQKQEELNKKVNEYVSTINHNTKPIIKSSSISTKKAVATTVPKIIKKSVNLKKKTKKKMRSIYGESYSHIMKKNKKEASKLTTAQRINNVEHITNVGGVLTGHKSGIAGLAVSATMEPIQHYNEKHRSRTSTENNIKAGASLATLVPIPYVGAVITSSLIASELKEATKHLEDSIAKKVVTEAVMREFETKYNKKITKAELKREVKKELRIYEITKYMNSYMNI